MAYTDQHKYDPAINFNHFISYMEKKYNFDVHDRIPPKSMFDSGYSFWDGVIESGEVNNDQIGHINFVYMEQEFPLLKEIVSHVFEEVEGHPAFDGESVTFYFSW